MCTRLAILIVFALSAPVIGCDDTMISISTDGQIEVAVHTSGLDTDTGFGVSVDGGVLQLVSAGASVTLIDLSAGSHSVLLSGVSDNCRVEGANPRTVVVGSDGTASVAFEVSCAMVSTGDLDVTVRTIGDQPDPDGYRLSVAGADTRAIGIDAHETFDGLTPGIHLITLKDLDPPCAVVGSNPQPVTTVRGQSVAVQLVVSCGPGGTPAASLR